LYSNTKSNKSAIFHPSAKAGQPAQLRLVLSQQMAFSLLAMWDAPTSKIYTRSVIRFYDHRFMKNTKKRLLIEIHMPIERLIEINRLYVGFLGD
jgi:hypothetical protein